MARVRSTCWPAGGKSSSRPPLPPSSAKAITASRCRSSSRACCATPPASPWPGCAAPRCTALHRLMEQYQQFDPFKFLIYAELAGVQIGPAE
jgi:hypothetical protein